MNMMISFLPILLIVIILVIVATFVNKTNKSTKFFSGKVTKIFLGTYFVLLLIATVVTYVAPMNEQTNRSGETTRETEERLTNFYSNMSQGKIDQIEGIKINHEWSLQLEGNKLYIKRSDYDPFGTPAIYIEKNATEKEIEVTQYITDHISYGYNYNDYIEPPQLIFHNDELTIVKQAPLEIRIAKFHHEFTITQFTGESMFNSHMNHITGENVIYIRLPQGVQVDFDQDMNIQFVSK